MANSCQKYLMVCGAVHSVWSTKLTIVWMRHGTQPVLYYSVQSAKNILQCAVQCLVFGQLKLTIDKTWQAASVILQCAVG